MAGKKANENMDVIDVTPQKSASSLSVVSKSDVEAQMRQRELLKEFVTSQLTEASFKDSKSASYGEGDYGVIPGTKKRCLFKRGAEKLQRLFGLGSRFTMVDKEIDRAANFAMFTYKCEVFHLGTGNTIAECEASANSQEVKYKERTVWKTKTVNGKPVRESTKEETPVFDVLNTLQKMAQKRALVGATLLATAASEYFTQDLLDAEDIAHGEPEKEIASTQELSKTQGEPGKTPQCCGQDMMISKYVDADLGHKPWYCLKCKAKVAAQ